MCVCVCTNVWKANSCYTYLLYNIISNNLYFKTTTYTRNNVCNL